MRLNLLPALILPVAYSAQDVTTAKGSKDYPNTYFGGFVLEEDHILLKGELFHSEMMKYATIGHIFEAPARHR